MSEPDSAFPKIDTATIEPSSTFHESRKYVPFLSSHHTPNAINLASISRVNSTVKHQSATPNASAKLSFSIARGDSNAIKIEETPMPVMINASNRWSSMTL